jgi:hypothetical protein
MSMRIRAILISSAAAVTAAMGMTSGASAATLYTDGTHGTAVTVGTTASATNTTAVVFTSATSVLNSCTTSTLNLVATANSGGTVSGTITSGTFQNHGAGCSPLAASGIFSTPWTLTVTGSATTSGGVTSWAATVNNVAFTLTGAGNYVGNLTTGVTAQQTGSSGAVCLVFNDAGTVSGPLTSNGRIDTKYCFEGGASSYSLG